VTKLLMHYAIPSERLPNLAKIGIAYLAVFAWRCAKCSEDFHLDRKPRYCPACGTEFTCEGRFGERTTRTQEISGQSDPEAPDHARRIP
jgi:hypothetical protein